MIRESVGKSSTHLKLSVLALLVYDLVLLVRDL